MAKIGRFVVDPKAGAYCHLTLDDGRKLLVSHDKGGFKGGTVTISEVRWWGLATGETVHACQLDTPEGQAVLARLTRGAPEGSARATPLGAYAEYLKECRTVEEVRERCRGLLTPPA